MVNAKAALIGCALATTISAMGAVAYASGKRRRPTPHVPTQKKRRAREPDRDADNSKPGRFWQAVPFGALVGHSYEDKHQNKSTLADEETRYRRRLEPKAQPKNELTERQEEMQQRIRKRKPESSQNEDAES